MKSIWGTSKKATIIISIILMFSLTLIGLISASSLGTVKQNDCITLYQTCPSCSYVNVTAIKYPLNSTIEIVNLKMTKTGSEYNYTFCNTSMLGEHFYTVKGDKDGVVSVEIISFTVTASGGTLVEGSVGILIMAILFMFLIGGVLLMGFLRKEQNMQSKWTLFILSFLFFLIGVNLISILIGDTSANPALINFFDSFMAIMFIIFWFAFGLLAIMWFLTFFQTILFKHKKRMEQKYD